MKIMKVLAVASMISLGALSMVACQKTEPDIKIEKDIQGTGIGEYKGDVEVTPQAPTQIQNTGDPIKDEASWPIGEFGYHEPPEELRTYNVNKLTGKVSEKSYVIPIHNDKYGNLQVEYNKSSGERRIVNTSSGNEILMIISEDNPISIEQALEDLRIGDSIADNFGK